MTEINRDQQMNTPQADRETDSDPRTKAASSHVGTALGVGLVGAVILISYIALYALYLTRV